MANKKNIDKLLEEMVNNNLQRRGTNPNRTYSRYIAPADTSTMANKPNFILGETSQLRYPNRQGFTMSKGSAVNYVGDYAKGNPPKFRGNGYIYGNPEVNKNLDILLKSKQDIGEVARDAVKTSGKAGVKINPKVALGLLPYLDAGIYAGQAYNDFRTGHLLRGVGQTALAVGDALFDTAALMATGGTGLVGKQLAKAGVKKVVEKIGPKATRFMLEQAGWKPALARGVASVGLEIGKDKVTGTSKMPIKQSNNTQPNNQQQTKGGTQQAVPYDNGGIPYGSTDDFVRQLVASNGIGQDGVPQYGVEQPTEGQQVGINQPTGGIDIGGIDKLLEYYNQQKELRKPYLEGLENFVNNYNDYNRQAFNMDRYLAGIAGWSGNQNFARMMGRYNPVKDEATRLDLLNKLSEEQSGELGALNKAIGNASILQEAGLPAEAMWADPNVIKNVGSIMNARTSADARRYIGELNYKAKVYDTYLDNKIRQEVANNRIANAIQLANLRENNRYRIAELNAQAYGGGGNGASISNALQKL